MGYGISSSAVVVSDEPIFSIESNIDSENKDILPVGGHTSGSIYIVDPV